MNKKISTNPLVKPFRQSRKTSLRLLLTKFFLTATLMANVIYASLPASPPTSPLESLSVSQETTGSLTSLASTTPKQPVKAIVKSPNDKRKYQSLELKNGLQVVLVNDEDEKNSTVSLTVKVGYFSDPVDAPGLAHFLEHMLFLGSKKYPKPDEHFSYLSQNGGYANAFTTSDATTYFFSTPTAALEGALDRFAHFFIDPLFDEKFVERELNAVNAEHSRNLNNDQLRLYQVEKTLVNYDHPYSKFSTGNSDTLRSPNLRERLIEFYLENYSADQMALVIVSDRPLSELASLAKKYFSDVASKERKAFEEAPKPVYNQDKLPAFIEVKPLKNFKSLRLVFPTPSYRKFYEEKPFFHLAKLVGDEGKGSLLSSLKKRNLASSLAAGGESQEDFARFYLNIGLTDLGEKNVFEIIRSVFAYLHLVERDGIEEWRFLENKKLAQIDFRYAEKYDSTDLAIFLSNSMFDIPLEDLLYYPYKYEVFNPSRLKQVLGYLTPDNLIAMLVSPEAKVDKVDQYYQTPFSRKKLETAKIKEWQKILSEGDNSLGLSLPKRNPFIPSDIEIKNLSEANSSKLTPKLLQETPKIDFWFLHDDDFNLPKSNLWIKLIAPKSYQSPQEAAMSKLLVSIWEEAINEEFYPVREAGFDFSLTANNYGFDGFITGYSEKFVALLNEKILPTLKSVEVAEKRFTIMRENLLKSWQNRKLASAAQLASYDFFVLSTLNVWHQSDYLQVIPDITLAEVRAFAKRVFSQMKMVIFLHGNVLEREGLSVFNAFANAFEETDALLEGQIPEDRYLILAEKNNFRQLKARENDSAVLSIYQYSKRSIKDILKCNILSQIINKPFFHQLRTIEQLGYVVNANMVEQNFVCNIAFLIQSPNQGPLEINERIETFLKNYKNRIKDFKEGELNKLKAAVAIVLKQPPQTMQDLSEQYWQAIQNKDFQFTLNEPYLAALASITSQDIIRLYEDLFLKKPVRNMVIKVFGQQNPPEKNPQAIENIGLFKKMSPYYGKIYPQRHSLN